MGGGGDRLLRMSTDVFTQESKMLDLKETNIRKIIKSHRSLILELKGMNLFRKTLD